MGLLDRAIKRGLNNAISNAVESSVQQVVRPKVEQAAANMANSAAQQINQAAGMQQQAAQQAAGVNRAELDQAASSLGGAFGAYAGVLQGFANEAAKSMKICPNCGEPAGADVKFCPSCGGKLPEQTVAQGALCPSCGKQNQIGTKFCADCGTKLPGALAQEQAAQAQFDATLAQWDSLLPEYPRWSFGGTDISIDPESDGYRHLGVRFPDGVSAEPQLKQYRQLLIQNGFHQAGQYPSVAHLYKKENGVCYHVDTEHCFDGGSDNLDIYFNISEPAGGYDYVKPAPKATPTAKDIFNLFK